MTVTSTRYERFESLGQNDYLTVYRGWDRQVRRFVAIMELDRRFRANDQQYERIWNEVLGFAAIEQYGLVRVYEVDKENSWIITELMTGRAIVQTDDLSLGNKQARAILRTCLDALGYLHQHGKVHGDIRPPNLLVDGKGHVRLSHPIGLAVGGQVPRRTMNQKYLAPELLKSEFGVAGPTSDLYCLGFSVYELLTGSRFDELVIGANGRTQGANSAAMNWLRWHSSEETCLPAIKSIVPGVASDIADVIDKLVVKHVAGRPGNAEEALAGLSEIDIEEQVFPVTEPVQSSSPAMDAKYERKSKPENIRVAPPMNQRRRDPVANQAPKRSPAKPSGSSAPLTLEQQLRKPWVFRSLAAVVLAIAACIGLMLQPKTTDPENKTPAKEPVAQVSKPPEATDQSLASLAASAETLKNSVQTLEGVVRAAHDNQQLLANELATLKEYVVQRNVVPEQIKDDKSTYQLRVDDLLTEAQRLFAAKDFEGAAAFFVFARSLQPTDAALGCDDLIEALFQIGWKKMEGKQYSLAAELFDQAVDVAGKQYGESIPQEVVKKALFGRGVARLQEGAVEEALKDLSSVIQVIPNSVATRIQRGIALTRIGKHKEALNDFNEAVRLDSNSYAAFNNRGACYLSLRMNSEAIDDFTAAVKLDDRKADGFYNRHIAYRRAGKFDRANDDLDHAKKIDPSIRVESTKPLPSPKESDHSVLSKDSPSQINRLGATR